MPTLEIKKQKIREAPQPVGRVSAFTEEFYWDTIWTVAGFHENVDLEQELRVRIDERLIKVEYGDVFRVIIAGERFADFRIGLVLEEEGENKTEVCDVCGEHRYGCTSVEDAFKKVYFVCPACIEATKED